MVLVPGAWHQSSDQADVRLWWSVPRARSQSASAPLYSGIGSAIRSLRVFGWSAPDTHSSSGKIVINDPYPRLQAYEIYGRSYYPGDL